MEQYRVYDRQTLAYVDGGVAKDYTVDMDYLSNNASTLSMVDETLAKKGDIVVGINGTSKIFLGAITAVDNTKKQISFKHMKELFNDAVLNVFKYSGILGYKFEAVGAIETILKLAFVDTDDTQRRLPLIIEKQGVASGAVWNDDGDTINVLDLVQILFDSHNVYLDFDIDFVANKIVCKIVKNTMSGLVIKDNIKLSEPTFDKNELPNYNKAIVYDKTNGAVKGTFYLLSNNTITTSATAINRLLPVATKYITYDTDKGVTPLELATSELSGNIYNHCIQYKLAKNQNLVKALNFNIGDGVTIIYNGREYNSIFTGLKYTKDDPFYTCYFGKTRIDFTDRLKQFIDKKYAKK